MDPGLRKLVREDLATHAHLKNSRGFQALLVHRFGRWRDSLSPGIRRKLLVLPYEILRRRVRSRHRMELHHTAMIGRRVRLSDLGGIVIGNESVLGDDCVVAADVTMAKTKVGRPGRPDIGDRVVIGPGAAFVGGVRVDDDAVIGPNVVVFMDVAARTALFAPEAHVEPRPESDIRRAPERRGLAPLERRSLPVGVTLGKGVLATPSVPPRLQGIIEFGDGCLLHERVSIGWNPPYDPRPGDAPTRLGRRVELSPGSVVLRGVSIGDDAWIGPNAVVDADVPAKMAVSCPPARVFGGLRGHSDG